MLPTFPLALVVFAETTYLSSFVLFINRLPCLEVTKGRISVTVTDLLHNINPRAYN